MSTESTFLKNSKIKSIQALRACAFLGIFASHLEIFSLGAWGVSIFLVLSGFIMYYAYSNRDLETGFEKNITFAVKKIKKLYPLHIITMILALAIEVYMYFEYIAPNNVRDFYERVVLNVFLVQSWIPEEYTYFSLNGVSWYLSTCLFLYFMFPYIMKRVKKYDSIFYAVIKVAAVMCLQILASIILQSFNATDEVVKWGTYIAPVYRLGDFYIGMVLGYIFFNRKKAFSTSGSLYFAFLITIIEAITIGLNIITQWIFNESIGLFGSVYFKFTLLYMPLSMIIVYLFALNEGFISKFLTNRFMIYIGEISGYGFIVHVVIIRYYNEFLYNKHFILSNSWTRFVICLGFTILVSHILNDLSIRKNITKNSTVCRI